MIALVRLLLFPLLIMMLILCSTVPALGKRATVDDPVWHAFGFDACALPCWAGITPGETPFDKAFDLLVQHVPALNTQVFMSGAQIPFTANLPDQTANGFIYYAQGEVGNIRLSVRLPLIQFIERLGTPSCFFYAEAYGSFGSLTMYWELEGVLIAALVSADDEGVEPTTSVNGVAFSPDESACDYAETQPWLGFAPRWRYEQADRRHG